MSNCLATTSRSSETPPSEGGVFCAVAAPAAKSVETRNGRTGGTRHVPAQTRLVIAFLFLIGRAAAMLRRTVRWIEPTSSPGRCARAEEEVGGKGTGGCRRRKHRRRREVGWRRGDKIDRRGAVMTEREAELAVGVRCYRGPVAAGRREGGQSRRASPRDGVRVMMPGAEHCLEKDREYAEGSGCPARRPV